MPTMKDVAKLAGVSVATVSCALSGAKNVSPKTQRRIKDAVEALRYIPNSVARDLKTMRNAEVGIVLSDIDDSYHADIFKGVSSVMQRSGYDINVAFSGNFADAEREKIDNMISRNVSGLILVTCQPDNTKYFRGRIADYGIPTVFVERKPLELDTNFAGFDNFKTIHSLAVRLIELGYKRISLVLGPKGLSCEQDCLDGFNRALEQHGMACDPSHICHTTMSKEDAFKVTMTAYGQNFPQAIIATSTTIAKGVLETTHIYHKRVPDDVVLVTLGEECWTQSDSLPGVMHTSRSAITLGARVAELLISNMQSPLLFEKQQIIMNDTVLLDKMRRPFPQERSASASRSAPRSFIGILANDLNTSNALKQLTRDFAYESGIDIRIEIASSYTKILEQIVADNQSKTLAYDMYLYDIPWLAYLAENRLLMDITEYVARSPFDESAVFSGSIQNFTYNGRYYGIPIVGGSQLLFYRKDIFRDQLLNRMFEQKYKISLRPPHSWAEFNGMCNFFTRECNPDSPTEFGTSITARYPEELICNILPYIWAHGGSLYDSNNRPCIDTPQNLKAFNAILETLRYTDGNCLNTTFETASVDFANGKTAMLIIFSEMLSTLSRILVAELNNKIGYAVIPGKSAVWPGWNFGVSNFTKKQDEIMLFINWICRKSTSYYLTILDGQSTMVEPYENNELRRLYPWLSFAADNEKYCHPRRPPAVKNGTRCIPQNLIERTVTEVFYDVVRNETPLKAALGKTQDKLCSIFADHGYGV